MEKRTSHLGIFVLRMAIEIAMYIGQLKKPKPLAERTEDIAVLLSKSANPQSGSCSLM